jgi:hypothetical protein
MRPFAAGNRRPRPVLLNGLAILALVAASCGGSGASSNSSSLPPSVPASPSPGPETGFRLRATTVQALPPLSIFAWMPSLLITDDLTAIQAGVIPAISPGPLVNPLFGARLTEEGWKAIADEAESSGLLSGATDFTGGAMPMGSAAGRLEIVIDGRTFDLTGDPTRVVRCGTQRCIPDPGTPEAFAAFWSRLTDLEGWLGDGIGPQEPWTPAAYAVLVGPAPAEEPPVAVEPLPWPFAGPSSSFGEVLAGDPTRRCGTVSGEAAASLTAALANASQLTRWRDPVAPDAPEALLGLVVRPLLPGEPDPCTLLVGN